MLIAHENRLFSTDLMYMVEDFENSVHLHFIGGASSIFIDFINMAEFNAWFIKEHNDNSPRFVSNSLIGKLYQKLLDQKLLEADVKKNEFLDLIKSYVDGRSIKFVTP